MSKLKFLRVVYLLPILLLGLWPVPIDCQQCGHQVAVECFFARAVSRFEDNFFCGLGCAKDWLNEHPLYDDNGDTIRRE
jgi:hypothetical protein